MPSEPVRTVPPRPGCRERLSRQRPAPPPTAGRIRTSRSVSRTLPIGVEMEASGCSVPTANSVDPPPMSSTRNGAGASSPWVAPRNDRAASRSPVMTSSSEPACARTAASSSSRFEASRTAAVAETRIRSACRARARRQYRARTSTVRASASGSIRPVRSTPWPIRVITMSRANSSRPRSSPGPAEATSNRIELVPRSTTPTRPGFSSGWTGSISPATQAPMGSRPPATWFA